MHQAADGGLARVRVPGGLLAPAQWRALADASARYGTGSLQLTSRGNVEIRGIRKHSEAGLAAALASASLLPSTSHERVRNIICSPLSGLDHRGRGDVSSLVGPLDRAISSCPELTKLSGRFLFGLDDGRGDVTGQRADVSLEVETGATVRLLIAGTDVGIVTSWQDGPHLLVGAAQAFLAERGLSQAWRVTELSDGTERIANRLGGAVGSCVSSRAQPTPLGFISAPDTTMSVVFGANFGQLSPAQVAVVAGQSPSHLRLTPWRSIVLAGLDILDSVRTLRELRSAGLAVDNSSPWRSVTACTGRPGCAKSFADVRTDAAMVDLRTLGAVHWSGCERRCGRPRGKVTDIVAGPVGYQVSGDNAVRERLSVLSGPFDR